jgi:type II secretory ATPase GspE/PulE/Tfp pilus assembly ATPase PilB-like protein
VEIDLHGYGPNDIVFCDVFQKIISQAWEIGAEDIYFIHGHGRN